MKRLVYKPRQEILEEILIGKSALPFQYANWWLYHQGIDDIIKSTTDFSNSNYGLVWDNRYKVVVELCDMIGYYNDTVEFWRKLI